MHPFCCPRFPTKVLFCLWLYVDVIPVLTDCFLSSLWVNSNTNNLICKTATAKGTAKKTIQITFAHQVKRIFGAAGRTSRRDAVLQLSFSKWLMIIGKKWIKKKTAIGIQNILFLSNPLWSWSPWDGWRQTLSADASCLNLSPTLTPPAKIKPSLNKIWTAQEMMFRNRTKSGKSHSSQRFFLFLPLYANTGLFSAFHFDGQQRAFWVKVFFTLWTRRPDCRSCRLGCIRARRADHLFKGRANRSPGQVFPIWN